MRLPFSILNVYGWKLKSSNTSRDPATARNKHSLFGRLPCGAKTFAPHPFMLRIQRSEPNSITNNTPTKAGVLFVAEMEGEVANTSTPVFIITDKTLQAVEKLVNSLKKLGIKYVDGELVYDEEEAGYEYLK